jgi:hypothetical protein
MGPQLRPARIFVLIFMVEFLSQMTRTQVRPARTFVWIFMVDLLSQMTRTHVRPARTFVWIFMCNSFVDVMWTCGHRANARWPPA